MWMIWGDGVKIYGLLNLVYDLIDGWLMQVRSWDVEGRLMDYLVIRGWNCVVICLRESRKLVIMCWRMRFRMYYGLTRCLRR
jgi:hypothetical protein